jgi:hypothetical protein
MSDELPVVIIAGLDPAIHHLLKIDGCADLWREDALRAFVRA